MRSRVIEVDQPTGEVVWRAAFETEDFLTYRAEKVDACDVFPDVRFCPDASDAYAAAADVFAP